MNLETCNLNDLRRGETWYVLVKFDSYPLPRMFKATRSYYGVGVGPNQGRDDQPIYLEKTDGLTTSKDSAQYLDKVDLDYFTRGNRVHRIRFPGEREYVRPSSEYND